MAAEAPWRLAAEPGVPDTLLDSGQVGDLAIRLASTRGPSHRFYGAVREDAAAVLNLDDQFVAAAVADGIGSVPGSAEASRLAVEFALRRVQARLPRLPEPAPDDLGPLLSEAITQANLALRHQRGGPPATTLTVAVVSAVPSPDRGHLFALAAVGDSPAFVLAGGRFAHVHSQTDVDELHSTRTAGLPAQRPPYRLFADYLPPGAVLLIASDGLGVPLSSADVQEELARRWRHAPDPIDFLTQVQFRRKSYDDDRSAVAIWTPEREDPVAASGPLPVPEPAVISQLGLPGPRVHLDAGQVGGLEVRAGSIHRHRPLSVGVVDAGNDRVLAALVLGRPGRDSAHDRCRELLGLARQRLLRSPAEPVDGLLTRTVEGATRPGNGLALALVDAEYRYWVVPAGAGAAYQLTGGGFVAVAGARYGSLGPHEALVLASDGLPPDLGHRWSAGIPGPSEFLDTLHRVEGVDRAAVAVWAVPGAPA
jgi:serine/threonine protein phosphatase PrpC